MADTVEKWLIRILGHEGGYSDDPDDPGGKTRWGISQRAYPYLDIANLPVEYAAEIYRRDYLKPLQWDRYHDGVAYQLLDFGVNSGPKTAIKRLQREIGVKDDGVVGPVTIARIGALSESDLIMVLIANRIEFMTDLKNWPEHGRGWMRRMAKNLRYGAEDSD